VPLDGYPLRNNNESVVRVQTRVDIDRSPSVDVGERKRGTTHDADPDGPNPGGADSFDEVVEPSDE
jgi:hypothetical protein